MPGLERLRATRLVASAAALDEARWPDSVPILRTAPDEALVVGDVRVDLASDPHAIVELETGMFGVWMTRSEALRRLGAQASWAASADPRSFVQGAVAGLPVKVWFEADRVLWLVPEAFATDFEERLL